MNGRLKRMSAMSHGQSGAEFIGLFDRTGDLEAIDKAIGALRKAVEAAQNDHSNSGTYLTNLSSAFHRRYGKTGSIEDINQAFRYAKEAEDNLPDDEPTRVIIWNNIGSVYYEMYSAPHSTHDEQPSIDQLREAVRYFERALNSTSRGDTGRVARLGNLGSALTRLYEGEEDPKYLDNAIDRLKEARNEVEKRGPLHPEYPMILGNLGGVLFKRFERSDSLGELLAAIENAAKVVCLEYEEPLLRGDRLQNFATMLESRYLRLGQKSDIEEAIKCAMQSVHLTALNPQHQAKCLDSLANKLLRKHAFERDGNFLDEAIKHMQKGLELSTDADIDRPRRKQNLANLLAERFKENQGDRDIERAMELAQEAVDETPPNHHALAQRLHNFAQKQLLSSDRASALKTFLQSWNSSTGLYSQRLMSAVAAVDLLIENETWKDAANLVCDAIKLLPFMNRRDLEPIDQQEVLGKFAGLAAKASSLILQSNGSVESSLEILEFGRGSILGLLMDDRRDVSHLKELYPELGTEYERLREQVSGSGVPSHAKESSEEQVNRRQQTCRNLDKCIERIRQLPGLDRFLKEASAEELRQHACEGPIIIVNVTSFRSDAIIVTSSNIQNVKLDDLSAEALRSWNISKLTTITARNEVREKNLDLRKFLSWIWNSCVKVILEALPDVRAASKGTAPETRLWWIGVGEASSIPFHAAGDHVEKPAETAFKYAISSYTPTIKALAFAREKLHKTRKNFSTGIDGQNKPEICVVAMPTTPKEKELKTVGKVLTSIQKAVEERFTVIRLRHPNVSRVRQQLETSQIVHFACHGKANKLNPFQSCLILQKQDIASESPEQDLLSVGDLARMNLSQSRLAYLSACSTAENKTVELADEVLHLVSSFQVAGFPHVIGTLWKADEEYCLKIAGQAYLNLSKEDIGTWENGHAARALHSAIIQTMNPKQPLNWAEWIHVGA